MKLRIINSRAFKYPNQTNPQSRFFEIYQNGSVEVDVDPEIGNAVPSKVWNREIIRFYIPDSFNRKDIISFYSANRSMFASVVSGMDTEWNGNNYIGTLTEEAKEALNSLTYSLYNG